jgi:hypothetical protein
MSRALEVWRKELAAGLRTPSAPCDFVWAAACREAADAEFEREYAAPQREYLARLREHRR